jgi:hypothetical protein
MVVEVNRPERPDAMLRVDVKVRIIRELLQKYVTTRAGCGMLEEWGVAITEAELGNASAKLGGGRSLRKRRLRISPSG